MEFTFTNNERFYMNVEPKVTIHLNVFGNDVPGTFDFSNVPENQHENVLRYLLASMHIN